MKRTILILLMGICIPFGCFSRGMHDSHEDRKDMSGYVFKDTEGKDCRFSDFEGKCIFVEIWSMSCRNCLMEMPYFHKLAAEYAEKDIRFVSICVENNPPLWKNFLEKRKIEGIQWNTRIFSPFLKENGLLALPGFALIDKAGKLVWKNRHKASDPSLKKELDRVLEEKL